MNPSSTLTQTKIFAYFNDQHNLQTETNFCFSLQFPQASKEACRLGDEVRQEEGLVGS